MTKASKILKPGGRVAETGPVDQATGGTDRFVANYRRRNPATDDATSHGFVKGQAACGSAPSPTSTLRLQTR